MQLYVFLLFFHVSFPPGYPLIIVFLPVFTPPTNSLGTLTEQLNKYIKENTFLDIWSAGLAYGFTEYFFRNNNGEISYPTNNISYHQFYAQFKAINDKQTTGHCHVNSTYNLTGVQKIEMMYNCNAITFLGVGVSKEKITYVDFALSASDVPYMYDDAYECFHKETVGSQVTNGVITLDVSDLSGDYYIYIYVYTAVQYSTFDIISIHGLYV